MNTNKLIKQIKKFNKEQEKLQDNIKTLRELSTEVAQTTINYWTQQNEIIKQINDTFKNL